MEQTLPLLADANFHLTTAEEFLAEQMHENARRELDKAQDALNELREHYRSLDEEGQGLLAQMARPLSAKAKRLSARLPRTRVISKAEAEHDPDQEIEPEE